MRSVNILLVILSVTAIACGPLPEGWEEGDFYGEADTPITNGTTYTGHTSVGWLLINGNTLCTATLIGPKTVLTAAHCIQTGKTHVFTVGGSAYTAASTHPHGSYNATTKANDIALLRLSTAPGVTPAVISPWKPTVGLGLTLIGYGITSSGATDQGTKRMATNSVATVTGTKFTFNGTGGAIGNTCFGDSGGPAFGSISGNDVQVGVTSGSSDPCGTQGVDTRVDAFYSWIISTSGGDMPGICTAAAVAPTPSTTASTGTTVILSASSTCPSGSTAQYKFMVKAPSGVTSLLREWSTASSYSWDTTGLSAGSYKLRLFVRQLGSTLSYELESKSDYTLTASTLCTAATITPSPATTAASGTTVSLTAGSTCPSGSTAEYKFMVKDNATGVTSLLRNWGTGTSYSWNTTGLAAGSYKLRLFVRQVAYDLSFEAEKKLDYTLTSSTSTVCTAASVTPTPSTTAPSGTGVGLVANSTCPSGSTAEYKFMVKDNATGVTSLLSNWGTMTGFVWFTAGLPAGSYKLRLFVRQVGSALTFEVEAKADYTLTAPPLSCTAATVTPSPLTSAASGTDVNMTASSTCPSGSNAEYKFMVKDNTSGITYLVNDWDIGPSSKWKTSGWPAGSYKLRLFVRQVGSALTFEVEAKTDYTLTEATTCVDATVTSTPSGTATVGTTVAVSGSSVCPSGSTAEYKFMIKPPSGATLLLRNWATGTTTSWDTTGLVAGVYKFRLFVRQVGSALTFEFEEKENITLTSP